MRSPVCVATQSALLGLLMALPAAAQTHAAQGPPPPSPPASLSGLGRELMPDHREHPDHGEKQVHKTIAALEDEWHNATLDGDTAVVDKLLADDYVGIGPDGTISSKPDELAARRTGERKFTQLDMLERKIRVYGTTAVVTSHAIVAGSYNGMPLHGEYRYTRVYNFSHGQWKIVSFEASPILAGRHGH